ncbi:MAG: EAL domain-containing protein [Actinomycetota bacterium]|nr:EAL domain-containing protein [Actinomycetota bacterium]MDQ2958217.1 EAL domain-containing protein [Actinomycetota bacterium]
MSSELSAPAYGRPSFGRLSLFALSWYPSVVLGWGLLAIAIAQVSTSTLVKAGAPLAMTAVLLVVLELRPLVQGSDHDPQGVVMSTAFACAILFLWGLWPALVVVSIASLAADLRMRKTAWKLFFNVGQYNLSISAAWVVMACSSRTPSLSNPLSTLTGGDLPWMIGACVVYFVTNLILVSGALAWTSSFWAFLFDDFPHYAATTFSVLALSPVIVAVANTAWELLPLLLVPLVLVYKMAQMSLEKEYQAGHDPLTGLPNRTRLQASLTAELNRSKRVGRPFGLLLIDLDHFKEVNDTLGHHVGDQLLIHFAERLSNSVRPTDHIARLGGDEFAVIVPDANEAEVLGVAERIRASLVSPIALEGMWLEVEASIGLAMHPEHALLAEDLLRLSDVAMYVAKESRSGVATYSAHRDRNSADRLTLLGELRQALDENALTLHYQPKVSLADSSLMGVEALIRWHHPQRGFIPPDEFIPLAERSGIMHLLTDRVVSLALAQLASWRAQGLSIRVAVNVSLTDLLGSRLIDLVLNGLHRYELPPGMLQLEITERVVAQQTDELNAILRNLEAVGVSLSLDDFGTGYSSLLRLQSLPVKELKIDRAFVSRLSEGTAAVGIVRSIVDLAHALGMPAIAEGVETEAEWQALRDLGCDGAQGWHIARPMPAIEATAWLRARLGYPPAELPAGNPAPSANDPNLVELAAADLPDAHDRAAARRPLSDTALQLVAGPDVRIDTAARIEASETDAVRTDAARAETVRIDGVRVETVPTDAVPLEAVAQTEAAH